MTETGGGKRTTPKAGGSLKLRQKRQVGKGAKLHSPVSTDRAMPAAAVLGSTTSLTQPPCKFVETIRASHPANSPVGGSVSVTLSKHQARARVCVRVHASKVLVPPIVGLPRDRTSGVHIKYSLGIKRRWF